MATTTNSTCDLDLTVSVPGNLDELAAKFGASVVYDAALSAGFYGPWNTKFRKEFVKKIEAETGVARRPITRGGETVTRTKRDGTVEPVLETEGSYLKFILESQAIDGARYAVIGQEVADTIAFELPSGERAAAPSKEFVKQARAILAMVENGTISPRTGQPVTEDSFTAAWEQANGRSLESIGGFTEEGIARALKIDQQRIIAQSSLV